MLFKAVRLAMKRYLQGVGHPDLPDVRSIVPSDVFQRDSNDAALRARHFLIAITGSDLLTLDQFSPTWHLVVNVTLGDGFTTTVRRPPLIGMKQYSADLFIVYR